MKDKTTAALLALFFGWFGIHRFYLRQTGLGILYIILSVSFISFLLGFIDAIVLFMMDQDDFDRKYNKTGSAFSGVPYQRRDLRKEYGSGSHRKLTDRPPVPYKRKTPENLNLPDRQKVNPYKQSGIKKYKEFDLDGAIEDFNKGLEISPNDVSLHFNLACAYSLTEQVDKAYRHLDLAVAYGFRDFEKIKSHDDLAFVRIQPRFDDFESDGFRLKPKTPEIEAPKKDLLSDDLLLAQLNRLTELKEKGLITEDEFLNEKKKLTR